MDPTAVTPFIPRYILAPHVATPPEVARAALRLAGLGPGQRLVDLGCGDGAVAVLAAVEFEADALGVDFEPHWIEQARIAAKVAGVQDRVRFEQADALAVPLAGFDVVFLYLVEWSVQRVVRQALAQLRPGARIVSHSFAGDDPAPDRSVLVTDAEGQPRRLHLWVAGNAC